MFQFKTINIITDLSLAMQYASQGSKVIYIGEREIPGLINLSVLSPSIQVVNIEMNAPDIFCMADGRINTDAAFEAYYTEYAAQLNMGPLCAEVYKSIIFILYATMFEDILIYVEEGEVNTFQIPALIKYFSEFFGLVPGTKTTEFAMGIYAASIIPALLYSEFDIQQLPFSIEYLLATTTPDTFNIVASQYQVFPRYGANEENVFGKLYRETNGAVTIENIQAKCAMYRRFFDGNTGTMQLAIRED